MFFTFENAIRIGGESLRWKVVDKCCIVQEKIHVDIESLCAILSLLLILLNFNRKTRKINEKRKRIFIYHRFRLIYTDLSTCLSVNPFRNHMYKLNNERRWTKIKEQEFCLFKKLCSLSSCDVINKLNYYS